MKNTLSLTFAFFILTTFLPGCRTNATGPSDGQPIAGQLSTLEKAIAASDNSFGFKLFAQINRNEQNKNVFISPFSVSMAFGMLLNGANGPTLDSLEQALGDAGMSLNDINTAYENSSAFLTALDAHVVFQNANSIWYRNGFPVLPAFLSVNKTGTSMQTSTVWILLSPARRRPSTIGWTRKQTARSRLSSTAVFLPVW